MWLNRRSSGTSSRSSKSVQAAPSHSKTSESPHTTTSRERCVSNAASGDGQTGWFSASTWYQKPFSNFHRSEKEETELIPPRSQMTLFTGSVAIAKSDRGAGDVPSRGGKIQLSSRYIIV